MNVLKKDFAELEPLRLVGRGPTWLDFKEGKISELTNREAMGLTESYSEGSIDQLSEEFEALFPLSKEALIDLLESQTADFKRRFVAGQLLGLRGDPRIHPLSPEMIAIAGWQGRLGLAASGLDVVVEAYRKYGVISEWIEKEMPEYEVDIKPFRMARFPVTNQEYLYFLKDSHHRGIPSSWAFGQYDPFRANHPVYTLSAEDCMVYARWLSEKTGRCFRLPTEAEWEYVAGGPQRMEFPWGGAFLPDHCNTVESGIFQTTPVGCFSKGDSPFGCADMAGNVEEFVSDFYKGYPGAAMIKDDLVDINGAYRVARGGSFTRFRDLARCRRRHGPNPAAIYAMGFRLAEDFSPTD
ncbi:MAG: SUMF1/EgtB/PvdO family nonheme iron enzyme [Bacteroidota bacterium]